MTLVDDYGRYEYDPELIRSLAFPFGDPSGQQIPAQTIASSCQQMSANDLIQIYEVDGKQYVQILRWKERTRTESRYPEPKNGVLRTFDSKCQQMIASPPQPQPQPQPASTPSPQPQPARTTQPADLGKGVSVDLKSLIPDKSARTNGDGASAVMELTGRLNGLYKRPETDPWTYDEQHLCASIARRPNWSVEWDTLIKFRRSLREKRWFPQSITALLGSWTAQLDKARLAERNPSIRGG